MKVTRQAMPIRPRLAAVTLVAAALVVHVLVVLSIARQPLGVHVRPETRAPVCDLFYDACHRFGPGVDLFAIYNAAQAVPRDATLYGDHREIHTPYFYSFRYLPLVAQTLGRGLLHLAPRRAFRVWILVLETALACLLGAYAWRTRGWVRAFGICSLLLSTPYFLELHMSQFTFLSTCCVAIAVWLVADAGGRRRLPSAAALVLFQCAVLLKLYPIVAAVPLLRRPRAWVASMLVLVPGVALSVAYFVSHPGEYAAFHATNFESNVGRDSGNFGFAYALYLVGREIPGLAAHWKGALEAWRIALLVLTAVAVLRTSNPPLPLAVAAMLLAHFVGYVHVWEHHVSALVVIGIVMLQALAFGESRRTRIACAVCVAALVVPTPYALLDPGKDPHIWDPFRQAPAWVHYALVLPKALPAAGLYAICMAALRRSTDAVPAA